MKNKAAYLAALFGGGSRLAAAIGVDPALPSRWQSDGPRGGHGRVPPHYNVRILDAARRARLDGREIAACLDTNICPCCRRVLRGDVRLEPMVPLNALPSEMRKKMAGSVG